MVNAIVDGLVAAGHARSSIIVWDRSLGGIKDAGYRAGSDGYQLQAITPHEGYDAKAVFTAPLMGQLIWGDLDYLGDARRMLSDIENSSNVSHFSKILSSEVTKIINVPVMSISETNGIAGCIYNMTIPNIDNWRRFAQGARFGEDSLAEIYSNPLIAKKVVTPIASIKTKTKAAISMLLWRQAAKASASVSVTLTIKGDPSRYLPAMMRGRLS